MQKVAQSWLVLTLTGSAFFLGLDAFLGDLPILLFTLIGGVVADRYDRRRLLLGSQYLQMSSAFALAALVYWDVGWGLGDLKTGDFDTVRIWHILTLSFLAGLAQAFGAPAYQSLIPSLVGKDDLPNAIALNSIQFNLARLIGPLLAGQALAIVGTAACFGLNGVSFLVVIVALMSLRLLQDAPGATQAIIDEMRGGLRYVRRERVLVALTFLAFATAFLGIPLLTFLPLFVKNVFRQDVGLYSTMLAYSGAGAVVGGLVAAWLGKFTHMGLMLLVMQMVFGGLVIAFAASDVLWISFLLLFVGGGSLVLVFSLMMSLVQLIAPNELRGRVMSIYMVAFRGGMPLGSLVTGALASVSSAPIVLAANGALIFLVSGYFLIKSHGVKEL